MLETGVGQHYIANSKNGVGRRMTFDVEAGLHINLCTGPSRLRPDVNGYNWLVLKLCETDLKNVDYKLDVVVQY